MIKYETIISNFDDKTTLYNWLRKVEEALKHASATNFVVNKKGNATLSFSITFADGTTLESGDIVLQQGESVDGARIASGVLQLHLTNGTWLTAGNIKPVNNFSINASQHLIVNYQDGTSQDLGAIFNGSVTIDGELQVTGDIHGDTLFLQTDAYIDGTLDAGKVTGNEIIEKMGVGYSFTPNPDDAHITKDFVYVGAVKNGNKLTLAVFVKFTPHDNYTNVIGTFYVPSEVHNKLYPTPIGTSTDKLLAGQVYCYSNFNAGVSCPYWVDKYTYNRIALAFVTTGLTAETEYIARFEVTFLLSDSLAQ